jgi:hypothetical protein
VKAQVFERLFGRKNDDSRPVRMPEVDEPADIEGVFAQARRSARDQAGAPDQSRQVVIVMPGRMMMLQPCPAPGSMAAGQVASIDWSKQRHGGSTSPWRGIQLGVTCVGGIASGRSVDGSRGKRVLQRL